MKKNDQITVQEGSGNVFADLDLPNSEQDQIKAELTLPIYRIIKKRNLTQAEAVENTGRSRGNPRNQAASCLRADAQPFRIFFCRADDGIPHRSGARR